MELTVNLIEKKKKLITALYKISFGRKTVQGRDDAHQIKGPDAHANARLKMHLILVLAPVSPF